MVSIYIVLSLVTIFSSFSETLGSEDTKFLAEMDQMMDNRMENFGDSHFRTNTSSPNLPLRTTTPTPSTHHPQTPSTTPPTLPPQPSVCSSYTNITDSWRHIDYVNRNAFDIHCDKTDNYDTYYATPKTYTNLAWDSWYRFTGAAGTELPTAPAPVGGGPRWGDQICGTIKVAWIKGGNPTIHDGIVTRFVCFEIGSYSCYYKRKVGVAACRDIHGDYFVYQLQHVLGSGDAYCAID